MSTTFEGKLTNNEGGRWFVYFKIDGIPNVFCMDGSAGQYETDDLQIITPCIAGAPQFGADEIDYANSRMIGGSFTCELVETSTSELAALFASRSRRVTWLTADATATSDPISVDDETALPTDPSLGFSYGYVDGETIIAEGTSAGSIDTLTRGAFGSTPQPHFGATENGASVFATPPQWAGRRLRCFAYFLKDNNDATTDLRKQLGVWRLDGVPEFMGAGKWKVSASSLADEIAQRKVYLGFGERGIISRTVDPDDGTISYFLRGGTSDEFEPGTRFAHMLIQYDGGDSGIEGVECHRILDVPTTRTVQVDIADRAQRGGAAPVFDKSTSVVRRIEILDGGYLNTLMLYALTSDLGDGANGAYDVLAGVAPTADGEPGRRMGAGIPLTEIDEDSLRAASLTSPPASIVLDDTHTVGDLLRDFCIITSSLWYVDEEGKLSFASLNRADEVSVLTIDDRPTAAGTAGNVVGELITRTDEDATIPWIRVKCNYNPITKDFEGLFEIVDRQLQARVERKDEAVEITSRMIVVEPYRIGSDGYVQRPTTTREEIQPILRRYQAANGRGRLLADAFVNHDALALLGVGKVVTFASAAPDRAGGTINGRKGRVVSIRRDLSAGGAAVTFEVLEAVFYIAPAAVVTAWDGGSLTLTLSTTAPENGGDTEPGNFFGEFIQLWDVSGNTSEDLVVASQTATTLVLSGAPAFTPAAGDFVTNVKGAYGGSDPNPNGFDTVDFIWQQPDDLSLDLTTRWQ